MKSLSKFWMLLLAAVMLTAFTVQAQTASSASTNTPPAAAKPKPKGKRYMGKIASVDADAKTLTFTMASGTSHVIHITSKTRIKKDGEPATLADAAVGLRVSGQEHQEGDDWIASTLNIGETKKPAASATPDKPAAPAK
jgi:hypothetical protein